MLPLPLALLRLHRVRVPPCPENTPAFPYTGLQAGMFARKSVRGRFSSCGEAQSRADPLIEVTMRARNVRVNERLRPTNPRANLQNGHI